MFPTVLRLHLPHTQEREAIVLAQNEALLPFNYVFLPTGDLVRKKSLRPIVEKILKNYDPSNKPLFEPIATEHIEELRVIFNEGTAVPAIETLLGVS